MAARWMESKTVTFAIGRGAETALLPKHLNSAEDMVAQLERQLKDIQARLLRIHEFVYGCTYALHLHLDNNCYVLLAGIAISRSEFRLNVLVLRGALAWQYVTLLHAAVC